jgi:hypothetical protein
MACPRLRSAGPGKCVVLGCRWRGGGLSCADGKDSSPPCSYPVLGKGASASGLWPCSLSYTIKVFFSKVLFPSDLSSTQSLLGQWFHPSPTAAKALLPEFLVTSHCFL